MRYLAFILFAWSCFGQAFSLSDPAFTGQRSAAVAGPGVSNIIATALGILDSVDEFTSYTNASSTPTANSLIMIGIVSAATAARTVSSVTGNGCTWVNGGSTNATPNGTNIVSVWYTMTNGVPLAGSQIVTFSGGMLGCELAAIMFTNCNVSGANGAGAIAQNVKGSGSGSNPTLTIAAVQNTNSALFWVNSNGDSNGSAGSSTTPYIELQDQGFTTPSTGLYSMYATNNVTTTPGITEGTAYQWGAIAIEVKQ